MNLEQGFPESDTFDLFKAIADSKLNIIMKYQCYSDEMVLCLDHACLH